MAQENLFFIHIIVPVNLHCKLFNFAYFFYFPTVVNTIASLPFQSFFFVTEFICFIILFFQLMMHIDSFALSFFAFSQGCVQNFTPDNERNCLKGAWVMFLLNFYSFILLIRVAKLHLWKLGRNIQRVTVHFQQVFYLQLIE